MLTGGFFRCTAISFRSRFSGRNLDVTSPFGEGVISMPRNYTLNFKRMPDVHEHYAIIGIGALIDGVPLLYDGANEVGLYVCALNFISNAVYHNAHSGFINLCHYEMIHYILSKCKSVKEAREVLGKINITADAFKNGLPPSELHWFIADEKEAITVEPMLDGLMIYDNPYGVLTNNPPFPFHLRITQAPVSSQYSVFDSIITLRQINVNIRSVLFQMILCIQNNQPIHSIYT